MNGLSIYIHIPYCLKKCPYCNFNSYELGEKRKVPEKYIDSLISELKIQKKLFKHDSKQIKSIYIGGGTPSLLEESQLERLISSIKKSFEFSNQRKIEISLEANPGTIDAEKLSKFESLGVTRFIIGVQSFNDKDLKKLGRIHTSDDSLRLLKDIKDVGVNNFGIDLIFGIPQQSLKNWLYNLKISILFQPKHISTYNLTLEEDTPIVEQITNKGCRLPNDELQFRMFYEGGNYLKKHGYIHYEISNFAKDGFESIHNKNYWFRGSYLGLGAGAHSFIREKKKRFWNVKDPSSYIKRLSKKELPIDGEEAINPSKELLEELLLSLRTCKGINKAKLFRKVNDPKVTSFINLLNNLGYLKLTGHSIILTEKGFFISNEIIGKLAQFL